MKNRHYIHIIITLGILSACFLLSGCFSMQVLGVRASIERVPVLKDRSADVEVTEGEPPFTTVVTK